MKKIIPQNLDLPYELDLLKKSMSLEAKNNFYFKLKHARLLVPGKDSLNYAVLTDNKKQAYIPVYTDSDEFAKSPPKLFSGADLITVCLDDLIHAFVEFQPKIKGFILNPFGRSMIFEEKIIEDIQRMTGHATYKRNDHSGGVEFCPIRNLNRDMLFAVRNFCKDKKFISRVWVLNAKEKSGEHITFVIEFEGLRREFFPVFAQVIIPYMERGQSFELMQADENLVKKASLICKPVFP